MANAETSAERLEGFISKNEDFHRSMNFLEVRKVVNERKKTCLVITFKAIFIFPNNFQIADY